MVESEFLRLDLNSEPSVSVDHPALSHANEKEPAHSPLLSICWWDISTRSLPLCLCHLVQHSKYFFLMLQLENENRWDHFFRIGRVRYHLCQGLVPIRGAMTSDPTRLLTRLIGSKVLAGSEGYATLSNVLKELKEESISV